MSYIDLAMITMHRRNELEGRINQFSEKCDHVINQIKKFKTKAQGFVLHLNCEPSQLKEHFLNSMKQLDEYMYLMTDFSLAAAQLEDVSSVDITPVLDTSHKILTPQHSSPYNLLDALSETTPSTSKRFQSLEKPKCMKIKKEDQTLIQFSSTSCSSESVLKSEVATKEVQCNILEEISHMSINDPENGGNSNSGPENPDAVENTWIETQTGPHSPQQAPEPCKLPAQKMLELDHPYTGNIMHIDGGHFWVVTDDVNDIYGLIVAMTEYYKENRTELSAEELQALSYCAYLEDNYYYRGLFLNLTKDDKNVAEIFLVDTGETRCARVRDIQPLDQQFCEKPPLARCCHLAGIDLLCYHNEDLMEEFEKLMKNFIGRPCSIKIDDNSSESLGVYIILHNNEVLNDIIIKQGFAYATDKAAQEEVQPNVDADLQQKLEITQGPEYEDPVEAVTGYHNRDEADICKHYKGGPKKTCFKGSRCTKRHVVKHPDGWTLDRVEVPVKCKSLPLPQPDTWHKVLVTCVCHFDRVYVQFVKDNEKEEVPEFGVVLPPMSLPSLVRDMNSAAARQTYKPLQIGPAQGEMVAAVYPFDNNWYRARVLSLTRSDQTVEVMYVDYGTTLWVKEDQVRALETKYMLLPSQAVRCAIAGVVVRSHNSLDWAAVKKALSELVQDHVMDAHIVAREYDELVVELYDDKGYNIAEQLATLDCVELTEFEVQHDTDLPQKIVVP